MIEWELYVTAINPVADPEHTVWCQGAGERRHESTEGERGTAYGEMNSS